MIVSQFLSLFISSACFVTALRLPNNAGLHFQLHRRSGRFVQHEIANLTNLAKVVEQAEQKYLRTYRDVADNRLVRRWASQFDELHMLDEAGLDGRWYFNLDIGSPVQTIEVDLDMLSPDFYTVMTSSDQGSRYDTFQAQSHDPGNRYVHPVCRLAKDVLVLTLSEQIGFEWPICQASHSSQHTLRKSGTIFGLSTHQSGSRNALSRLDGPHLLEELHAIGAIPSAIWSITLLDSFSGVLSLGGTIAKEMATIKATTELEFEHLGQEHVEQQLQNELQQRLFAIGATPEEQFNWLPVRGANGWWTGLVSSIWVNGIKILKNQPFLLDVNCPLILAPPSAFSHFHQSISGSKLLRSPGDRFAVYPCLNPPEITFEIAGKQFPFMARGTRDDAIYGPAGGGFSLGKMNDMAALEHYQNDSALDSGFCVANVVRSAMIEKKAWDTSGIKNTWVLGEPFFKGLGLVFESNKEPRIGFRSY